MRTLNRNDERYQESRSDATRSKRSSVSRPQSLGRYSVASERSDPSLPPTQTTATVVPIEEAVAVSTVFALFSPNDTIRQTFTKAILVGLTVVTGAFGIVSLVVWSAVIGGGTCSDCLGYYVAAIAPLVIMIMTSGVLLYARSVRQVPDACMDVVFVGAAINICATAIAVPSFPGTYFCLATSILVALCKTPRILFHALILSVVWWICAVNEVYLAFTGGTPASLFLPRSIPPTQVSGFIYYAVAYLVSGALVYTISIVLNMYERNQQISDNTRDMCIKVHGFLHTYATDDARAAITPYAHANEQKARSEHSDAGPDDHLVVDHDILTALSEMVDRIERFRTHLPNWVIRTDPNSSPADPGSELPSGVSTPSHRAGPTLSKTSSSVGRYSGHAFKPLQPAFFGKVSYCALDFGFDSTRIFATSGDPEHIVALFVERVHVHVEVTQGSLHSFVGDQVVASFNATSRCTNHELAAVSFAMRVRGDPGSQFVFSSGYVTTTDARTQLTGSAGSAAFLVSLKTKSLPTTLQLISREAQSLVIDAVTNIAAKNTFETRAIDAVWVTDNSSSAWRLQPQSIERVASMSAFLDSTDFEISLHGSTAPPTSSAGVLRPGAHTQLAYQVVKDRQARMNQQNEWIYVVDRTPGEVVNRDVTNATVKCVDGLYEDALAILSKLPLDVRNDPAVSRLAKAAQWCSDKNVPQGYFARRVPHATTSKPAAESSSSPTMQQTSEPEITRSAPLQLVFGGGANP